MGVALVPDFIDQARSDAIAAFLPAAPPFSALNTPAFFKQYLTQAPWTGTLNAFRSFGGAGASKDTNQAVGRLVVLGGPGAPGVSDEYVDQCFRGITRFMMPTMMGQNIWSPSQGTFLPLRKATSVSSTSIGGVPGGPNTEFPVADFWGNWNANNLDKWWTTLCFKNESGGWTYLHPTGYAGGALQFLDPGQGKRPAASCEYALNRTPISTITAIVDNGDGTLTITDSSASWPVPVPQTQVDQAAYPNGYYPDGTPTTLVCPKGYWGYRNWIATENGVDVFKGESSSGGFVMEAISKVGGLVGMAIRSSTANSVVVVDPGLALRPQVGSQYRIGHGFAYPYPTLSQWKSGGGELRGWYGTKWNYCMFRNRANIQPVNYSEPHNNGNILAPVIMAAFLMRGYMDAGRKRQLDEAWAGLVKHDPQGANALNAAGRDVYNTFDAFLSIGSLYPDFDGGNRSDNNNQSHIWTSIYLLVLHLARQSGQIEQALFSGRASRVYGYFQGLSDNLDGEVRAGDYYREGMHYLPFHAEPLACAAGIDQIFGGDLGWFKGWSKMVDTCSMLAVVNTEGRWNVLPLADTYPIGDIQAAWSWVWSIAKRAGWTTTPQFDYWAWKFPPTGYGQDSQGRCATALIMEERSLLPAPSEDPILVVHDQAKHGFTIVSDDATGNHGLTILMVNSPETALTHRLDNVCATYAIFDGREMLCGPGYSDYGNPTGEVYHRKIAGGNVSAPSFTGASLDRRTSYSYPGQPQVTRPPNTGDENAAMSPPRGGDGAPKGRFIENTPTRITQEHYAVCEGVRRMSFFPGKGVAIYVELAAQVADPLFAKWFGPWRDLRPQTAYPSTASESVVRIRGGNWTSTYTPGTTVRVAWRWIGGGHVSGVVQSSVFKTRAQYIADTGVDLRDLATSQAEGDAGVTVVTLTAPLGVDLPGKAGNEGDRVQAERADALSQYSASGNRLRMQTDAAHGHRMLVDAYSDGEVSTRIERDSAFRYNSTFCGKRPYGVDQAANATYLVSVVQFCRDASEERTVTQIDRLTYKVGNDVLTIPDWPSPQVAPTIGLSQGNVSGGVQGPPTYERIDTFDRTDGSLVAGSKASSGGVWTANGGSGALFVRDDGTGNKVVRSESGALGQVEQSGHFPGDLACLSRVTLGVVTVGDGAAYGGPVLIGSRTVSLRVDGNGNATLRLDGQQQGAAYVIPDFAPGKSYRLELDWSPPISAGGPCTIKGYIDGELRLQILNNTTVPQIVSPGFNLVRSNLSIDLWGTNSLA